MSAAGIDLLNRDEELKVLSDFLAHSHELPLALLLQGEAGIGKTTLWRCGVKLARDSGGIFAGEEPLLSRPDVTAFLGQTCASLATASGHCL